VRWTVAAWALCIVTAGMYASVGGHAFVEFDDPLYVSRNPNVALGLTLENARWALTTGDAFIWHPLTWLSYLLDASLWGTSRAGPWLLTNVALHCLNVFLLFALLWRTTARVAGDERLLACGATAALFALHPIQVESVAWVSARKEVLAGTGLLLTLLAYERYVRRPGAGRYAALAAAMAVALTAKGSHVALPFGLLLLDAWPLGRLATAAGQGAARASRLLLEKLPLLVLSAGSVAINGWLVANNDNPWVTDPGLFARLAAIPVNLVAVIGRVLWPSGLAIVYPNPLQPVVDPAPLPQVVACAVLLVGASVLALRARGYWATGWGWFPVMLLPMMGAIPMGLRTPHDRYVYVPLIGLALVAGFALGDVARRGVAWRRGAVAIAVLALVVLGVATRRQVDVWSDSLTLFDHALRVTRDNAIAHYAKGVFLAREGRTPEALAQFERALALHPRHPSSHNNVGYLLAEAGQPERGIAHLKLALEGRPKWTRAIMNLGRAQLAAGTLEEAVASFERAVASAPEMASVRSALGVALLRAGRRDEAAAAFRAALRLDPEDPTARRALAPAAPDGPPPP